MRHAAVLLLVIAALACAPSEPPPAEPASAAAPAGPPTLDEIATATVAGLDVSDGPITLVEGRWEGEPYEEGAVSRPAVQLVEGLRITADLDSEGTDEAVALLSSSTGGSGERLYLAAFEHRVAGVESIAVALVGDRVKIRGWRAEADLVVLDTLQAGEGDAMCCPGELATRAWRMTGDGLTEVMTEVTGRLSLAVLDAGAEWVLRAWDLGEPAPEEPEVTLAYVEGRLAGTSGCNRYFARVEAGPNPGEIEVGPVAGTMMACPGDAMEVESRYQRRLDGVTKYGFHLGRLALTYTTDDGAGTMLFERRETPPGEE